MDTNSKYTQDEGGYVLIYRRLLQNPIFRTDAEAMAFAWLVMRASWRDVKVRYKERMIDLQRGQVAISSRDLAARLERNKDWANRFFKRLSDCDMVRVTSETGVNVVTICNYDNFQGLSANAAPASLQGRDTSDPQNNTKNKTNKENKLNTTTARGTRLPNDWMPTAECADFAKTELSWTYGDVVAEGKEFRDYWIAQPASKGVKNDWYATWRNWVRRSYRKPSSAGEAEYPTPSEFKDRKKYLESYCSQWAGYNWSALEAGSDKDKAYAAKTRKQISALRKELKGLANGPA